jgi:site-specific DNA recombinase
MTIQHAAKAGAETSVAAYYRVSTGRQAEADLSLPDQRRQANAYASAKGWKIVAEFTEAGASGTNSGRPELQRLLDLATSGLGEFSIILVHSFSRLYRDHIEFGVALRRLERKGVRVVSMTQELGHDVTHDMIRQIIAVFDEFQSRENSKHTKRAMLENARQGFWNGSSPPLGYRVVEAELRGQKVKKKLEVEPTEAAVIRLVFNLYLNGDGKQASLGCKSIAAYLNESGVTTRKGGRFGVGGIHKILTARTYAGTHVFNRRDSRTGEAKPATEQIEVSVPPIIESDRFAQVQRLLAERNPKAQPPRVVTGPILLTGLVRCATCGGAMTSTTGKSGRYRYYSCSTAGRQGRVGCAGRRIPMDFLDGLVLDHLERRLLTKERMTELLGRLLKRRDASLGDVRAKRQKALARATDAETKLGRLYAAIENGVADAADLTLRERIEENKRERDAARSEAERLLGIQNQPRGEYDPATYERFASTMREHLRNPEIGFRRAYLRLFTDRIEVDKEEVRIFGRTDKLLKTASAGSSGTGGTSVPSFVPEWRPHGDSNPGYRRERAMS